MQRLPEWAAKKILRAFTRKTRKGMINDLIDLFLHPLFGRTFGLAEVIDFILHCVNEGKVDLRKFQIYNLPSFLFSLWVVVNELSKRR